MSKFNTVQTPAKIINRAGGEAYAQSPKLALVNLLLTSFLKDTYYEAEKEQLARLDLLLQSVDPQFAAKAAIFARTEFGMRSVTHYLAGWLAGRPEVRGAKEGHPGGEPISWQRKFFTRVVHRADDILEIAAAYRKIYGGTKRLPHALGRGLRDAQVKLSEYKLAKYLGKGKDWNQWDIVRLEHGNSPAIAKLMSGTLPPADTWEHAISESGKKASETTKAEEWARLINSEALPYFAALRNIRNIIAADLDDKTIDKFIQLLTNAEAIKKSLVLPFRYLTALKALEVIPGASRYLAAISQAVDIALANVPVLPGKTLVALDGSGSMMSNPINQRADGKQTSCPIQAAEAGALFAAALVKRSNADLILFSDHAKYISLNTADSLLGMANSVPFSPAGTNFHSIFQRACKPYDRIIILSDEQGWIGYDTPETALSLYSQKYECKPFIYSWNLISYGDAQFPEERVARLAGWSDKVFDIMKTVEEDRSAMIARIEAIEL